MDTAKPRKTVESRVGISGTTLPISEKCKDKGYGVKGYISCIFPSLHLDSDMSLIYSFIKSLLISGQSFIQLLSSDFGTGYSLLWDRFALREAAPWQTSMVPSPNVKKRYNCILPEAFDLQWALKHTNRKSGPSIIQYVQFNRYKNKVIPQ